MNQLKIIKRRVLMSNSLLEVANLPEKHDHVSNLSENGYTIFRNVFSSEQISLLRATLSSYLITHGRFNYGGKFELRGLHAAKEVAYVLSSDNYLNLLKTCIHPDAVVVTGECDFTINTISGWHKDITEEMVLGNDIFSDPHWTVYKAAIYLQDQDLQSSSVLKVRSGSHMMVDGRKICFKPLPIRTGDVIIFDVRIDHAGQSPSISDKFLHCLFKMAGFWFKADAERWFTVARSRFASISRKQQDRMAVFMTFGPAAPCTYAYEKAGRKRHGPFPADIDRCFLEKLSSQDIRMIHST
jgi:hypothetical protein